MSRGTCHPYQSIFLALSFFYVLLWHLSIFKNIYNNHHLYSIIRLGEMSLLVGVRVVSLSLHGPFVATCVFTASMPLFSAYQFLGVIISYRYINVFNSRLNESSELVFKVASLETWTLVIGSRGERHISRPTRLCMKCHQSNYQNFCARPYSNKTLFFVFASHDDVNSGVTQVLGNLVTKARASPKHAKRKCLCAFVCHTIIGWFNTNTIQQLLRLDLIFHSDAIYTFISSAILHYISFISMDHVSLQSVNWLWYIHSWLKELYEIFSIMNHDI